LRGRESISEDSLVVRADGHRSAELADGDLVVLSVASGGYYGLNPVGARIWSLLQEPRTVRELEGRMLEEFEVDPARCAREVRDLLRDLADFGLVEVTRAGSA
jgi:hypothetical protein